MITKTQVSGLIHFIGAELSIAALVVMVYLASVHGTATTVVSFVIFGACLILLYSASTIYHLLPEGTKARRVLRYIDHVMIYVLIAGTYTPICLVALRGIFGWVLFGMIWGIAGFGIVITCLWFDVPRKISTAFYIAMGWMVVIATVPLAKAVSWGGVFLLVIGGVMYTVGGVIYGLKKPDFKLKYFGFHEIFHVFIILGSLFHVLLMTNYIAYIR